MSTLANERRGLVQRQDRARARGAHPIPRFQARLYGDGAFDMTRSFGGKPFKL